MAWATVPVLAPLLGSYIQTYLGWRYNFVLLTIAALSLAFFIQFFVPETLSTPAKHTLANTVGRYKEILSNRKFLQFIFIVMIFYGISTVFNTAGPFLLQTVYHFSPVKYGWLLVFIASGYILGSYLTSKVIDRFSVSKITLFGTSILAAFTALLLGIALSPLNSPWFLVIGMFFILFSVGTVYPLCVASCLNPFPHQAGLASAIFGCMVFLGGTLASLLMAHLHEQTMLPLATVLFCLAVLIFLLNCIPVREGD